MARATLFGKSSANDMKAAVGRAKSQYLRYDRPALTSFGFISWIATIVRNGILISYI